MRIVDTRGERCPKPIIETRKALKEVQPGETFRVLTDSRTSFGNISRFLKDNGIGFTVSENNGTWAFDVAGGQGESTLTRAEEYCEIPDAKTTDSGFAVAIASEFMGSGDDVLGGKLINSFFVALSCLDTLPSVIAFYNSGVKLASSDSPVIDLLHELETRGVELILCGTCTDYFGISGKTGAGKIGDMFVIMQKLSASSRVIYP